MGMIFTTDKCKNPKKKPGWQKAKAEEEAWLKSINSMSAFSTSKYKPTKPIKQLQNPVKDGTLVGADRKVEAKSLGTFGGVATKKLVRPEFEYKNNEEMLARELAAREVKHNAAPLYNKGAAGFVSQEELQNVLSSNKRRS